MTQHSSQRGSAALEVLLALTGAVLVSAIGLPVFFRQVGGYLRRFYE